MIDLRDPGDGVPCLKHDVAYGSLQRFVLDQQGQEPGNTLDAAWNPRNKYLADHIFLIDGICGVQTGQDRRDCLPGADNNLKLLNMLFHLPWWDSPDGEWLNAKIQQAFVAHVNSKLWPITDQDVEHAEANQEYLACNAPGLTGTPRVTHNSGTSFSILWQPTSGCALITSTYTFCFGVIHGGDGRQSPHCEDFDARYGQTYGYLTFTLPEDLANWRALGLVQARIIPNNRAYPLWALSYPAYEFPNAGGYTVLEAAE